MLAQNVAVPGSVAAQTPEGPPPPQPEEKKEGEKFGKEEKKDEEGEKKDENTTPQSWNVHAQTTFIAQGDPGFPAQYSGPNSLNNVGERQSTVTADAFAGVRLWRGAEVHADFLMWEGYGLSQTFGIEDFPNGDAYKAATTLPDFMAAHLFVRQTFGLGGEQEDVADGPLTLAGKQDISRLTFTVGRFTPTDMFENNTYAHDPHTQFMNWATNTNVTWDYASDQVGYTTGIAAELNQPTGPCATDSSKCRACRMVSPRTTGFSCGRAAAAVARFSNIGAWWRNLSAVGRSTVIRGRFAFWPGSTKPTWPITKWRRPYCVLTLRLRVARRERE